MTITGLQNVSGNNTALSASKGNELGKAAFLTLLIEQLKAQDPLNPMDSTEFTAQLSQFSSLEQLQSVNENLDDLKTYQASSNNSQAVDFVGKSVMAVGNSIDLTDGSSNNISFELEKDSNNLFVNIYDDAGDLVRTIEKSSLIAGQHDISWNGKDNQGNKLPDGRYSFEVMAYDVEGGYIKSNTYMNGRVTGVSFKNGIAYLMVGNQEISVGNVVQVKMDKNEESNFLF